jgi:hypothetical protein
MFLLSASFDDKSATSTTDLDVELHAVDTPPVNMPRVVPAPPLSLTSSMHGSGAKVKRMFSRSQLVLK